MKELIKKRFGQEGFGPEDPWGILLIFLTSFFVANFLNPLPGSPMSVRCVESCAPFPLELLQMRQER
jgi:hypothetical protein